MTKQDLLDFLEWLKGQGCRIALPHVHSDFCKDSKGKKRCGYSRGEWQPLQRGEEQLVERYMAQK
jgi:hypothetical protein